MRRSLLLVAVATFVTASVAPAATDREAPRATLLQAVAQTNDAGSFRYVMTIAVSQENRPTAELQIHGTRGPHLLFVRVKATSSPALPGQQQSALLDGPFLYEGAPDGIAVYGSIRWLRVPVASLSPTSKPLTSMRNLSPAPLLRLVDESSLARKHMPKGLFRGKLAYDDAIVHTALSGMSGGIEFRKVRYTARVGADGFVHTINVTGTTADGSRTLSIRARLHSFGLRVDLKPPAEGTFMDRKLLNLAE
ncbi:MAG: hypothetical protein ACXVRJ_05875 [Gaiellaceae bacterium]